MRSERRGGGRLRPGAGGPGRGGTPRRPPAVHHLPAEVKGGELLAVVGPTGAGKSTLLKGVIGELKPLSGSLELDGLRKSVMAYLPQQFAIDRSSPLNL